MKRVGKPGEAGHERDEQGILDRERAELIESEEIRLAGCAMRKGGDEFLKERDKERGKTVQESSR
ncbi:MAG: hypothetical protein ABFD84_02025 [Candidatus Polarisedimenticolia bacterium]|nr:hypothetical protein [bacterium]